MSREPRPRPSRGPRGGRQRHPRQPATPIWERPEPGARRASYSREQIAATAIEIADAEGFEAVSMRRVAAAIGAGTMTLYHYVRNKDELIALIDDAIMGEIVIAPDELPEGWRDGFAEIARRSRDAFINHPWSFDVAMGTEGGPNGTRHFEQSLEVASRTGLDPLTQLEVISLVDDYVFGFALRMNRIRAAVDTDPARMADDWSEFLVERLDVLNVEEYPRIKALFAARPPAEALKEMIESALGPQRFEHGLDLILDGIERLIERSS